MKGRARGQFVHPVKFIVQAGPKTASQVIAKLEVRLLKREGANVSIAERLQIVPRVRSAIVAY